LTTFTDLGVSPPVLRALAARGVTEPFEVQSRVIPDALAGRDVLVRSRTGSGKTLAFAIPVVERLKPVSPRPSALILTPTRELAVQVAGALRDVATPRNLRVAVVYGGVSIREQERAVQKSHVIVATPGRLEDLVSRGSVSLAQITILVLDEADHMLDMGFAPQVEKLVARIGAERQTMLFSATLDGEVGKIARRYTRSPVSHSVAAPPAAEADVEHTFVYVASDQKVEKLAALLREGASTLVFVRTKHGADRLAKNLAAHHGIKTAAMHGNKSQSQREAALASFAAGRVSALVATDVAARGIDVRNVARVINFDAPGDDKSFVHRVGRTGRAGATGTSITFVSRDDRHEMGRMAARLDLHEEFAVEHGSVPSAHVAKPAPRPGRGRRPAPPRGRASSTGRSRRRSR
jgi:ATP-dependent RNA helicase RhlE